MAKEMGDYPLAGQCYAEAAQARPDDADLQLQLGHFHKTAGRYAEAARHYARADDLGHPEAAAERARMEELLPRPPAGMALEQLGALAPALEPRATLPTLAFDGLRFHRVGRREHTAWGMRVTLRGVEAVRGMHGAPMPFDTVEVRLGDRLLARAAVERHPFARLPAGDTRAKHVFNLWIDVADAPRGLHPLEVRLTGPDDARHIWREPVVVADPLPPGAAPGSDALVQPGAGPPETLEARIRALPTAVHPARRALFPDGVARVLVIRTDQLGDAVASLPALRRLRALVGDARVVMLATAANADLMRTTGLADEVIAVDFPDDPLERRRVMPLDRQAELAAKLAAYRFDLAIDLSLAGVSRDLLRLSGARFTHGFAGGDWPWLSSGFQFDTHDVRTGHDVHPHSAKVLALVEALGAAMAPAPPVLRRDDLPRDRLAPYGIGPDERLVVMHTGARLAFSRWPGYPDLARALLAQTDLRVVVMGENAGLRESMGDALLADPRFLLLDRRLPFDDLDAFLSFAAVMVGNDSGPKHLASLRGTPAVTLFSARIDWREWGQEQAGVVMSRRVPCAGCAIFHDADECGKDFACIRDIRVDEVLAQVLALL